MECAPADIFQAISFSTLRPLDIRRLILSGNAAVPEDDATYFRRRAADEAARAETAHCPEATDAHRRLSTLFAECAERCEAPNLLSQG